jgi:hypothetical protein
MILFISPYPDFKTEREGSMQRISAVDKIFANKRRIYVPVSMEKTQESSIRVSYISKNLEVYQLNLNIDSPVKKSREILNKLKELALKATFIYVQNIYNACYILPFYKYKKVITDMHGLVPEEENYKGEQLKAKYFGEIEKFIVYNSFALITVSNPMINHFRDKYPDMKTKMLNMPIIDDLPVDFFQEPGIDKKNKMTIIYSGGTQKWQNIDAMLSAISHCRSRFKFIILTINTEEFSKKIAGYGLRDNIEIISVPKKEIRKFYQQADFGFILRDNSILNRAACPTKLIEYLSFGVIPIVMHPEIGDFFEKNYSYIALDNFIHGNIPSANKLKLMKSNNFKVIRQLHETFLNSKKELFKLMEKNPQSIQGPDLLMSLTEFYGMTHLAQLFIDTDSGFNEKQSILELIKPGVEIIEFDLSNYQNIQALRFDPVNDMALIRIEKMSIICENDEILEVSDYRCNSFFRENNTLLFSTIDPQMYLDVNLTTSSRPRKIIIRLDYLSIGPGTFQYNLMLENLELRKKIEELKSKEVEQ